MKKAAVKIGMSYRAKVSGKIQTVRITGECPYGGWDGENSATGRRIRIRSASRLRILSVRALLSEGEYRAVLEAVRRDREQRINPACDHPLDCDGCSTCDCADGVFYGREEVSDAAPGL